MEVTAAMEVFATRASASKLKTLLYLLTNKSTKMANLVRCGTGNTAAPEVPPHFAEHPEILATKARIAIINEIKTRLDEESQLLMVNAANLEFPHDTLVEFETRWKEIMHHIENVIRTAMCVSPAADGHWTLLLVRKVTVHGQVWVWKLVYPEEKLKENYGRHNQTLDLSSYSFLPTSNILNEPFVRFLADMNKINQWFELNLN